MGISIRTQTAISTGREYGHTRPVSSSTLRADATKGDGMGRRMRDRIATFYYDGNRWIVTEGFGETVLTTFSERTACVDYVTQYNQKLSVAK